jgi:hypothetical protein
MRGTGFALSDVLEGSRVVNAKAFRLDSSFNPKDTYMKKNEGSVDRVLRISAGLILIGLAATSVVGVWGYVGIVPLLTGAIGMCPIYTLLRINSCPVNRR